MFQKKKSCVNKFYAVIEVLWCGNVLWIMNAELCMCEVHYPLFPKIILSPVGYQTTLGFWIWAIREDVCQPYTQSKSDLPLLWTRVGYMPLGYANVQSQCVFHGPIKPMGLYQRYLSISKGSPFDMTGDFPLRPINNLILTINSGGLWKALWKVKAWGNGSSFRFCWSKAFS